MKIRHLIALKRHNKLSKVLMFRFVGLISVVVSVLDFYAGSFLFFELGQGVRYQLGSPIFICLLCLFLLLVCVFSISTETFMPVDIRHCRKWN